MILGRVSYLGRPTYMSADLYFTTDSSSSFFLSFFFRRLISELAERNSTKIGHMVRSKCSLKTHVQNLGYPLLLQIGDPKPPFGRLRNLTANFTAYIFGMNYDIDKRKVGVIPPEIKLGANFLHFFGFRQLGYLMENIC